MHAIRHIENRLALLEDERSLSVMDHGWREQAQAGMAMLFVVPTKEPLRESAAVLNAAEAIRELRAILHGSELTFRIRVVIGDVRTAVRFGDSQISQ